MIIHIFDELRRARRCLNEVAHQREVGSMVRARIARGVHQLHREVEALGRRVRALGRQDILLAQD